MEEVEIVELAKTGEGSEQDALDFLAKPGLIGHIIEDIAALGYTGEDRNKSLVHLVATSRKMENPLACIVRGESSAGKSYLIETVIRLIPAEEKEILTRATKQAFFHERDLSNKFIYIREADGCEEASYAVRALLSEKELVLKRTVGLGVEKFVVHGPVAYAETTAEPTVDTQRANRVFEVWVDESEEQTLEIHKVQRERYTLKGLESNQRIQELIEKHHIAQRLLEQVPVVIPYAMEMDFPSKLVRSRRDHQRFLDLISASAFLHQFQRPHGQLSGQEYVEATLEDYEIAYWLMEPILLQALDNYGAKPRELLDGINEMVRKCAEEERKSLRDIVFTRSDIGDFLGWTKRQVRTHIKELEELEAVEIVRGGRGREYRYRLLHNSSNIMWPGRLLKPEELKRKVQNHYQS